MSTRRKSVIPPAQVEGLRGSLAMTNIFDLFQFLNSSRKTGQLLVDTEPEHLEGRAYFSSGALVHVVAAEAAGIDALVEMCSWEQGTFSFYDDVLSPQVTINMPMQHALMEAVRIHDERRRAAQSSGRQQQGGETMSRARSSTDVLEDFLKVPGVLSAVVIGRDGFLIESAGASSAVNVEDLGAALAHAVNGVEEMGNELQVNKFQDLFVEYGRAVIMCRPVGDAVIAIVAPDASKLGIIRHKVKPLVEELAAHF